MTMTWTDEEELELELEEEDDEDEDPESEPEFESELEPADDEPSEDEEEEPLDTDPDEPDDTIVAPGLEDWVAATELLDCACGWEEGAGMLGFGAGPRPALCEPGGAGAGPDGFGGVGFDIEPIDGAGPNPAALGAPAVMVAVHMLTTSVTVTVCAAP